MATLEMVEKLKEKANVTYDEAKAALEACGDDMLEALIHLERQGKVRPPEGGTYSTRLEVVPSGGGSYQSTGDRAPGESFGDIMRRFWNWIKKMVHKGNTNSFEVWRNGTRSVALPVTVMILLILFCFWVTIPLLVIGLFFGCHYRFQGPEMGDSSLNDVMETAARGADSLKNEVLHAEAEGQDKDE